MARLTIKSSVVKRLYAVSGNKCCYPNCTEMLVTSKGTIIGEICHIEAAEKGGERFNEKSDDEYRRSFDNLMLMCGKHHKITNDVNTYTVTRLKSFKADHELKFSGDVYRATDDIVQQTIENYMKQQNQNSNNGGQINNQAHNQNIGTQIGTQNIYNSTEDAFSEDLANESIRQVNKKLKSKIDKLRNDASPPTEDVIDFKNNLFANRPSKIYELPISILKFRKENGRIKADVESYEKLNGTLVEIEESTQNLLRDFLIKNDPEKKDVLKQQIKHKGQLQPAIVTCDGFLINGNRRKMILEELYEESHQDSKYENMRVIILPENVSVFDIKRIENRYQLQDDGKSEYHGLNRALTIRDNIRDNYSLKAQILDDPQYSDKVGKDLTSVENDFKKRYLNPLECVDRYLKTFDREGLYNTISESSGDKEGRWQAFIDYSNFYYGTLDNAAERLKLGIKQDEVGLIENAIFKIIRKRNLNSPEIEKALGKLHAFVRGGNLKKYLGNSEAKKYFIKIAKEVSEDISEGKKKNKEGQNYSEREIDEKWSNDAQVKQGVLGNLMRAYKVVNTHSERNKPLELLEDALKKLRHDNLTIENMDTSYYEKAMDLTREIVDEAENIYTALDKARYEFKKLNKKGKL